MIRNRGMIRSLLIAAFVASAVRPACAGEPYGDVQSLRELMAERLAVMEYVAAFKWNEGLPVEDKPREAKVVRETLARAGVDSADAGEVSRALSAQIEAAKRVQRSLFASWEAANKDHRSAVPDLQISLRPRIGRMSNALIASFLAAHDDLETCAALDILGPVPKVLAHVPEAWEVAVAGVLDLKQPCPAAN